MSLLRSLFYLIVKLLSVVGIVVCLTGIAGSWIDNESLTGDLTQGVIGIENILNVTGKGIGRAESELTGIRDKIERIDEEISQVGNELVDNALRRSGFPSCLI